MKSTGHIVVYVTTGDLEAARKIAGSLLENKLAACVNIVPEVESHFRWQGDIESARECLLIVKTRETRLPQLIETVKGLHTYEVPEIIALPVTGGNDDYMDWLDSETA